MKVTTVPLPPVEPPKPNVLIELTDEEALRLQSALDTNFQWYRSVTKSGTDERWAGDLFEAIFGARLSR